VFGVVKRLKVFFKYCREAEKLFLHPEVKELRAVYLEVEKIFLTWEELEKLAAADLPDHQAKVRTATCFLLPVMRIGVKGFADNPPTVLHLE
jgi:hypothetical protein